MKERPIIFNDEMVRAILDGRKTQTRRPVKPQPYMNSAGMLAWKCSGCLKNGERTAEQVLAASCPYGQPGDRLWVRECFAWIGENPDDAFATPNGNYFRADLHLANCLRWRPSIHMPRWASRITLEITAVRVERVQDISDFEAYQEGASADTGTMTGPLCKSFTEGFFHLWESIYGTTDYAWTANPWVWVVEFRMVGQ